MISTHMHGIIYCITFYSVYFVALQTRSKATYLYYDKQNLCMQSWLCCYVTYIVIVIINVYAGKVLWWNIKHACIATCNAMILAIGHWHEIVSLKH